MLVQDEDSDSDAPPRKAVQAKPKIVLRFPGRKEDPPADPLRRTRAAAAVEDSDEEELAAPPPRTRNHAREEAEAPTTRIMEGRSRLRKAA